MPLSCRVGALTLFLLGWCFASFPSWVVLCLYSCLGSALPLILLVWCFTSVSNWWCFASVSSWVVLCLCFFLDSALHLFLLGWCFVFASTLVVFYLFVFELLLFLLRRRFSIVRFWGCCSFSGWCFASVSFWVVLCHCSLWGGASPMFLFFVALCLYSCWGSASLKLSFLILCTCLRSVHVRKIVKEISEMFV